MNAKLSRNNLQGGAWLIADLSLNIWALSIVKALGADYPSAQVVFLRAVVGFVLISPMIWWRRAEFRNLVDLPLHLLRVFLSVVTLTSSFFAIARVPLATFTAIGFTRPLVTMVLAAVLLQETVRGRQWTAAGVALAGVVISLDPLSVPWTLGLGALGVTVIAGSAAVIATRRLRAAPFIVLMAFYTGGLSIFTAPIAAMNWTPIATGHLHWLLLVGCFAQLAQACFLRAHAQGTAGFLSVLSYLSLVFSVVTGYAIFGEVPTPSFFVGASLVICAALFVTRAERAGT